jgi:aquaporin Z
MSPAMEAPSTATGSAGARKAADERAPVAVGPAAGERADGAREAAPRSWLTTARRHWPEYVIEGAGLGLFMVSACAFGTLLEFPGSPLRAALPDAMTRRVLMGIAMGLTVVSLVYSPWGMRSGAHFNPAVTLAFWRLGRVAGVDAALYTLAQFAGAAAGVALVAAAIGGPLAMPPVSYVVTAPGPAGAGVAFAAEVAISALLMSAVLAASNTARVARLTGALAGTLVALFITFEGPISGMSMNPARSAASAVAAMGAPAQWIYFVAPPLGMLLAAEAHVRLRGARSVFCAKLHHDSAERCIFCEWRGDAQAGGSRAGA